MCSGFEHQKHRKQRDFRPRYVCTQTLIARVWYYEQFIRKRHLITSDNSSSTRISLSYAELIDIKKNIIDNILNIIDDEKELFNKENNYILIMNLLLEQKKQIEQLRKITADQSEIINKLSYGL